MSRKPVIALVSAAVAGLVGWLVLVRGKEPPTVRLHDNTREVGELLDERQAGAPGEGGDGGTAPIGWPPPRDREPLSPEIVFKLFSLDENVMVYDPLQLYRPRGNLRYKVPFAEHPRKGWMRITNSLGMREDTEPAAVKPDLRVIVTGDSHVDGVCANAESVANVLEALLGARDSGREPGRSVEVLNAGVGGYNPWNYLGTVERHLALDPDVFVVVLYGGNDFSGVMNLRRFYERSGRASTTPIDPQVLVQASRKVLGVVSQDLSQAVYFVDNPGDEARASESLAWITGEMQRLCTEAGTRLVCVYLPPVSSGQPELFATQVTKGMELVGLDREQVAVSDRLADAWLALLAERGIEAIDARALFRPIEERCYWYTDHHLNLLGHRVLAEALEELLR